MVRKYSVAFTKNKDRMDRKQKRDFIKEVNTLKQYHREGQTDIYGIA